LQKKNFSVEFSISKEIFISSNFSHNIHKAKNEGMITERTSESNHYKYTIYAETQNALYDVLSGDISLLENLKWYKHQNRDKTEFKFI